MFYPERSAIKQIQTGSKTCSIPMKNDKKRQTGSRTDSCVFIPGSYLDHLNKLPIGRVTPW